MVMIFSKLHPDPGRNLPFRGSALMEPPPADRVMHDSMPIFRALLLIQEQRVAAES